MKNQRITTITRKFLALLLVFSVFIGLSPNDVLSTFSEESSLINEALPEQDVPEVIEREQVEENGHIRRMRDKEEDLSTVIFANDDGTETAYMFAEDVKYVDENGVISDKSNRLHRNFKKKSRSGDYAYANIENDIVTYFPKTLNAETGVDLEYDGRVVSLHPISESDSKVGAKVYEKDNLVYYDGSFGKDTKLRYETNFNGYKEDIVLDSYVGNVFRFALDCGTLVPEYEENGGINLVDAETKEVFSVISPIYVHDSNENETYDNKLEFHEISAGKYELVITVDDEFLRSDKTVYPVYVDPTVTISGFGTTNMTSSHVWEGGLTGGAGDSRHWVGVDERGRKSRYVMRFHGLPNETFMLNQLDIISATFHLKDSSGTSTSAVVGAYYAANTTGWDVTGSRIASYTYNGSRTDGFFDITAALKEWQKNPVGSNKRLIFKNDTSETDATRLKKLNSVYNSVANAPYLEVSYRQPIKQNDTIDVNITKANQKYYYSFTPMTTGFYTIESFNNGTSNPRGWLYNESNSILTNHDNISSANQNFRIVYHLFAGRKYNIEAGCSGTGTGSYQFKISPTTNLGSVSITPSPTTISPTTERETSITKAFEVKYFRFTAPSAGLYVFQSHTNTGDPYGWLYNTNGGLLAQNDDISNTNRNFRVSANLTANQTVFLVAGCYNNNTGSFTVKMATAGTGKTTLGTFQADIPNNIGNTFGSAPATTRIITWQTDTSVTSGEVIIGTTVYTATSTPADGRMYHRAVITGLSQNTEYTYMCGNAINGYSKAYKFRTAPSSVSSFTILHVTDPQIGSDPVSGTIYAGTGKNNVRDAQLWQKTMQTAINRVSNAAFVVNTGDVIDSSGSGQLNRISHYFDYPQDIIANSSFIYSLGNNDHPMWYNRHFATAGSSDNSHRSDCEYTTDPLLCICPRNYSFVYGNTLFINAHNAEGTPNINTSNTGWLVTQLQRKNNDPAIKWMVVMMHESPYGRSNPSNATETALANLFYTYDVDLVLAGHNHFYARSHPINGSGVRTLDNNKQPLNAGKYGTVYSIPNTTGSKFNASQSRNWLVHGVRVQQSMFTTITFTSSNIVLNAYTVEENGTSTLYDTYSFR